ncbi:MAG: TIM barrel protein [Gordonia sp. (in: high G+C Gram-positive bacteria)]
MHHRISVSTLNFPGTDLATILTILGDLTITRTTVQGSLMKTHGWERSIAQIIGSGITVDALIAPYPHTLADRATWSQSGEDITRTIEAAAEIGAPSVYTVTGPLLRDRAHSLAQLVEFLTPQVDRARDAGIRLALEATLPSFAAVSFVHTVAAARPLLDELDMGLCLDLYHLWDDPDLADWLAHDANNTLLCQIGDCVVDGDQRPKTPLGKGVIPLADRIGAVAASGYSGAFDIELTPSTFITADDIVSVVGDATNYLDDVLTQVLPG